MAQTQTMSLLLNSPTEECAWQIQVRGLVQGVGFRPTVWNLAQRYHLRGRVLNNGQGVEIWAAGEKSHLENFLRELADHPPLLATIHTLDWKHIPPDAIPENEFWIANTESTGKETGILPDAATCPDCLAEIHNPSARRFQYPFTNCTHCGPRLTIQQHIPYERLHTTMQAFTMCEACDREYRDPQDRRFHAEPIACPECGPKVWLESPNGDLGAFQLDGITDALDSVAALLHRGNIVAIKGLGGFQLACDATKEECVHRLRTLKQREGKPFALMARDIETILHYCQVSKAESAVLQSASAPIVLLARNNQQELAPSVAPGASTYGFMLPNTPLHHLILDRLTVPIVLTSGNRAGEPQGIENASVKEQLRSIADYFVMHDREITQRVDDSVVKVMGNIPRLFRRSRGYAPAPINLPEGFEQAPVVLAMGGELKNTFCFLKQGQALLSHHIGDLEDAMTNADYRRALEHYQPLFGQRPELIAIDRHPEYVSSKLGKEEAERNRISAVEIQHHHAHLAACLAENGIPLKTTPVLGIILDGLGYGEDGTFWGGEFLAGDYRRYTRLGTCKPVAMLGGGKAITEPWRNTYAHLMSEMGWDSLSENYHQLPLYHYLGSKPRYLLDQMVRRGLNSPRASSCGRLFDAVAAAMGVCQDRVTFEGQAAMELEALVDRTALQDAHHPRGYPFAIRHSPGFQLPYIEPLPMWEALLDDLLLNTPPPIMAARFHAGLARAICSMVDKVNQTPEGPPRYQTVALSGGVFQNTILFELVQTQLSERGLTVLTHRAVPTNDGGLALGQAAIAAAQTIDEERGKRACV